MTGNKKVCYNIAVRFISQYFSHYSKPVNIESYTYSCMFTLIIPTINQKLLSEWLKIISKYKLKSFSIEPVIQADNTKGFKITIN